MTQMISSKPACFVPQPTKKQIRIVDGTIQIDFESDIEREIVGKEMNKVQTTLFDTTVKISTVFKRECLFVMSGKDIDSFTKEFTTLIEKYRI